MRKFLITMMCVIMVVCFMPTVAMAAVTLEGSGTEISPYIVDTAEELGAAIAAGGYIKLAGDITITSPMQITKSVTIDGGEKTGSDISNGTGCYSITISGGDRVFNVSGENKLVFPLNIDLQNVQVNGPTTGTYTRGLSVWKANGNVNITLDNVKLTSNYYALNIAGENTDVDVNITNSTLEGWCALQTWSNDTKFTIRNSVLRGINDKSYNADGWNDFSTIVVNEDVSGTQIDIFDSEILAKTENGNFQSLFSIRAAGNALNLSDCTLSAEGSHRIDESTTEEQYCSYNVVDRSTLKIDGNVYYANGSDLSTEAVAKAHDVYYSDLGLAIDDAQVADTVTLLNDVELTQKMTINESITIDGKGHKISAADGFTQDHLMLLQSNVTMKNVTLDSNGKAKGINTYGNDKSLKISFENVKMLKSLGNGLTAKGGTITLKNVEISGSGWKQSVDISASNDYNNGADLVVDRYCSFGDQGAVVFDNPGTGTKVGTVTSSDPSRLIVSSADETKDWANDSKPYTKRVFTLTKVSTGGITTPPTPTDNVTNSGSTAADNASTNADLSNTTSTSNGTTTATVDKTTADKIVDKAVENKSTEVVIDATANTTTAANSTTIAQVTIPTETLGAIAEKTEADVTIKTDVAEVKMDNAAAAAVSEQATGDTVQIVVEKVAEETDKVEFELKVVCSDGKVISNFNGGNIAVTVALPKAMAEKKVVCVYIDDNGHMSKVEGQKNADGTYTFVTGHFSSYAIMAEEEADAAIAAQKEAIKNIKIKLTSKQVKTKSGKKGIKITWTAAAGDKTLDGVEVFRSKERYKGYGTEPFYTSTKGGNEGSYINTKSLKKGTKYYYRVRGYVLVDGQKVYTDYSTKAWRTVK